MRGRSAAAALSLLLASAVTACTGGAKSTQPGQRAATATSATATSATATSATATSATATSAAPSSGQALGAPGCRPASPVTFLGPYLPQVEGTGHDATLWGLLMFPHALPARVGDQEKIVWRMTGTGSLALEAISPGGTHHRLAWGPDAHMSSNWDKPGDEWGAGYVFAAPGCWDLRAVRGNATADVWILVSVR